MTRTKFQEHLRELEACSEAYKWAGARTAQQTWDECERADWLLWWYARDKPEGKIEIVKVACKIARLALKFVPEGELRPLQAIEAAEAWADNPTEENLEKVRVARRSCYASASYAAAAASYAAYAAAAAYAYAAASYAAADADADAARKDMQDQCAKVVRDNLQCPWGETNECH